MRTGRTAGSTRHRGGVWIAISGWRSLTSRAIATTGSTRPSNMTGVPTIAEPGYPGFEAAVWYGFIAPKGTPKAVVEKVHAEVQKALKSQEVIDRMTAVGGEVSPATTEQFREMIRAERQRYEKLIRDAKIKPD